ncbi:hypothetical protein GS481_01825 [Rhodococcus hoagii]|nr:hypothetical protein [Prescottella equi]
MTEIPYDEMRRILGLPDVKREVELLRLQLSIRRAGAALAEAGRKLARAWAAEPIQSDYALAAPGDAIG